MQRTFVFGSIGIVAATLWLVVLKASGFSNLAVGLGLMGALILMALSG